MAGSAAALLLIIACGAANAQSEPAGGGVEGGNMSPPVADTTPVMPVEEGQPSVDPSVAKE